MANPTKWICSRCNKVLKSSFYDTTWILPDKSEKYLFNVEGAVCENCRIFVFSSDLKPLHGLREAKLKGAIENDVAYRKRTK